MREILFRGKRIEDGQWVEGHYHFANWYLPPSMEIVDRTHYILQIGHGDADKIDPETVGQFTGLTDKNGKKIFEGDIVKHYCGGINDRLIDIGVVFWDSSRCMFLRTSDDGSNKPQIWSNCRYEVIGNIHDNPELLGEG